MLTSTLHVHAFIFYSVTKQILPPLRGDAIALLVIWTGVHFVNILYLWALPSPPYTCHMQLLCAILFETYIH